MGHLKNIGKKECCADCTPNKCDACSQCQVFAFRSLCTDDPPDICKRGWTDFDHAVDGVTPSGCDPCRRWSTRTLTESSAWCNESNEQSQRDETSGAIVLTNTSHTANPTGGNSNIGSPAATWEQYEVDGNDPGDVCYEDETLDSQDTWHAIHRAVDTVDTYTCSLIEVTYDTTSTFNGDGSGSASETLSGEVTWEDAVDEAMSSVVECDRESCIVDTVETEAERLALTGLSAGDIVIQTDDSEGDPHCGDGMHWEYLGGGESDAENWSSRGLLFRCDYESPATPAGCAKRMAAARSWLWSDSDPNCPSLPVDADDGGLKDVCLTGDISLRVTDLAISLRDLVVGNQYRLTLHYRRCPIDDASPPDCSSTAYSGDCVDEEVDPEDIEWTRVTEVIEFTASDWAEILAWDCSDLAVRIRKCELEEEADALNAQDSGTRSVSCTAQTVRLPIDLGAYHDLDSPACTLEDITAP